MSKAQAGDYSVDASSAEGPVASSAKASQTSCSCAPSSAPSSPCRSTRRRRGRRRRSRCSVTGPGGFALERSYALNVQAGDAGADAPHRAAARQGREPHAVERSVRRSRAGHRRVALSVGASTALDAATLAEGARPLSVRLLRADHQPRAAAALRQRAGERRRISRSTPRSTSASATPSSALLARQASNGSFGLWSRRRRRCLARRLCHRLPDAGARARLRGAGRRRSSWRSTGCATTSPPRRSRRKDGGRDLAYALYVLARNGVGAGRRPALPRRHQARRARNPDRQGADRRGARPARRPGARRARLSGGARHSIAAGSRELNSAAPITARRCATRRRW